MKRLGSTLLLAMVAMLGGMMLQCASDPAVSGDGGVIDALLVDLGVKDAKPGDGARDVGDALADTLRDGIGPKADAAPPAAIDSFKMTYKRNGGTADVLLAPASNVSASARVTFLSGTLRTRLSTVTFVVPNDSIDAFITLTVSLAQIDKPTTTPKAQGSVNEESSFAGSKVSLYKGNCTVTAGKIDKIGPDELSGALTFQCTQSPTGSKTRVIDIPSFRVRPDPIISELVP